MDTRSPPLIAVCFDIENRKLKIALINLYDDSNKLMQFSIFLI